ncbi:2Fe-2S iron-sulfur cluster-binding protein [Pseudomonadota bacterium]
MKHLVRQAGTDQQFFCREDQHLLQGMQNFQLGVPMLEAIPVGCRGGGCGICRIRILEGVYEAKKMSRKHIPEQDQARGIVLACRVYPRSELAIEVLSLPEPQ